MYRAICLVVALFMANLSYTISSVVGHALAGSVSTALSYYLMRDAATTEECMLNQYSSKAPSDLAAYVRRCFKQMPELSDTFIRSVDIRVFTYEFYALSAQEDSISYDMPDACVHNCTVYVSNFTVPDTSQEHEDWARLQYMILAHEMGHVVAEHSQWIYTARVSVQVLLTGVHALTGALVAGVGWIMHICAFIGAQIYSNRVYSCSMAEYERDQEDDADRFAFRQARDIQDIRALQGLFSYLIAHHEGDDEDSHELHIHRKHPHPQYRMETAEQYIKHVRHRLLFPRKGEIVVRKNTEPQR